MSIVVLLILGCALGWLASRFAGSGAYGMLGDLVAGGAGASLGGFLAGRLALHDPTGFGLPGIALALLGAGLLIAATRLLSGSSRLASTLKFWRPDSVVSLPEAVRQRLAKDRGLNAEDGGRFRMLQERGQYTGRTVTYFQVFDPASVGTPGADLSRLETLDARNILHSGFIERDGQVVLNDRSTELGSRPRAWPDGVSAV